MKCTKTSEAFLHCEKLIAVAFVKKNVDAFFIQSKRKIYSISKLLSYFLEINVK